ncbi:MAG TPA: glucans biosynthesis glucosyltransferase MdoH [Xanthobacteraceae bacterium]|nr:glucans biosynthesis glucosyltransferase MdoH [Xanthobacteraceae bacterium]
MDAVTSRRASAETSGAASNRPFLPSESPLDMPRQSLRQTAGQLARPTTSPRGIAVRRLALLVVTAGLTVFAGYEMYDVLAVGGLTLLEMLVLVLFVPLCAWLALSFSTTLAGLLSERAPGVALGIDAAGPLPRLSSRNALLAPTYNETPHRVFARLQAIYESLAETGQIDRFDLFILSDTTDPDIWIAEEAAFLDLRDRADGHARIFYRHRRYNEERKAGNIADWVRRFGGAYDHMIVLDADSLMTGDTIVRLAHAMERNPQVGLIQTHPVVVNAKTLFARVQQFAGRIYGPLIARGLAWWQGSEGNYSGHNAIVRTRAFAQAAGLPHLRGRKPFGGHIMSHDFVEAALMRRAGWAIHFVPELDGSYEEVPPTLSDYVARDRRWCQGNMQHMAVLPASGLHWISRLHLLIGISAYLTAPLWLLFLVTGLLISFQARFTPPDYFPSGFSLFPQWPAQDPVRAAWVFAGTMGLLLAPKLMSYVAVLGTPALRKTSGGTLRVFISVVIETLVSGLLAPVLMLAQSTGVVGILAGRDVGWTVQRRDVEALPASELLRRYAWYSLLGLWLALAAYELSVPLFFWMTPVILGLALAVPLAALTSRPGAGRALRRLGLLLTPEERAAPPILARANALAEDATDGKPIEAVEALRSNPDLLAAHARSLPEPAARRPGDIDVDLVVGIAKLEDVDALEDALLTRAEKVALLSDRRGFDLLVAKNQAQF